MASSVEQILAQVQTAGGDLQAFADALAQKLEEGGNIAVRASNATTGAAVGAKAGSTVPVTISPTVKYAGLAFLAYLFLRR
jgi:hypothetical protein